VSSVSRHRARVAGAPCVFRAQLRADVWSVTKDDEFYGEHLSRNEALVSACSAARSMEALGCVAEVRVGPRDDLVRHQDRYPQPFARRRA
jgi:hypothetical protein